MMWNNSQAVYWTLHKTDSNPNSGTRLILDRSNFFSSLFFFQDKLDKMQIGSGEDVNDLNYDYDNEQCVARGGN